MTFIAKNLYLDDQAAHININEFNQVLLHIR
jgi:hypothetical protein